VFKYIIRRVISLIPVLFFVSLIVFFITRIIPGDPAAVLLGETATIGAVDQLREELGLNDPLRVQYGKFLLELLHGNLGESIAYNKPVTELIANTLPNTLLLGLTAISLALIIAIPIGILSARKQNSWIDYLGMLISLFGVSMPIYWLGMMLVYAFAVKNNIFPAIGMGSLSKGFHDVILHLTLPSICLATIPMANFARITRSSMLEVIRQDYIRTARAKGLRESVVIWKHALKNALIPILTVIGMQISMMLSGAVLTETIFSWPGMGRLIVDAIEKRDFIVVQGTIMFLAFTFVVITLLVDILYALVSPKVRLDKVGAK
jgi:peptide/nickel transport system permease protein